MMHVTVHFKASGLTVQDVSDQNLGYDLVVTDAQGTLLHKIEVKGTSTQTPGFFLTRNERACSKREATWRLAVVTDALVKAEQTFYTAEEMEQSFDFDVLVWRCDLTS